MENINITLPSSGKRVSVRVERKKNENLSLESISGSNYCFVATTDCTRRMGRVIFKRKNKLD